MDRAENSAARGETMEFTSAQTKARRMYVEKRIGEEKRKESGEGDFTSGA